MRQTFFMAKEMVNGVGGGYLLLRPVPQTPLMLSGS
jgi:hypothetical protein